MVLVADDEPTMLELVARHLRSIDEPRLVILEASDGDEAWRIARERLPDLVVLDVMMPGMSGWEVCRKIRQDAALAHTGVLMLTGIGESLNEATSPLFGADEYIDKPFDFEKLDAKVLSVLRKRASQRESVPRAAHDRSTPAREDLEASGNGIAGPAKAASRRPTRTRSKPAAKARAAARSRAQPKQDKPGKTEKGKGKMAAKKGAKKAAKKVAKKVAKKTAKKGAKKAAKKVAKKVAKKSKK